MSKKTLSITLSLSVIGLVLIFVFGKVSLFSEFFNTSLSSVVPYNQTYTETSGPKATTSVTVLTKEINLDVPFTSQAPHLNWDQPYQDFCEEASVLMAVQYLH